MDEFDCSVTRRRLWSIKEGTIKIMVTKSPNELKIVVTKNGPYLVSGNVPLAIQVITPNEEGASWDWVQGQTFKVEASCALCRCGHSRNKP